jgi:PAT family acetyl-CoA transporter-like MFS transporter 1
MDDTNKNKFEDNLLDQEARKSDAQTDGLVDQKQTQEENIPPDEKSKPKKKKNEDIGNIIFLLFLYVLQGIPAGLSFSIPLILSSRKVSYADQGTFSFASWPFSMKLLW